MSKSLIDILADAAADAYWTDERIGKYGEKLTARELRLVRLLGRKGEILRNVYIPKENGETSEIDVIYITQKGIFVIESKNYSGWIFGDEKSAYWTASLPNKQKNRFYSPILQNRTHIRWMNHYLEAKGFKNVPMFSLIVFYERCEIKKMNVTIPDVRVIKRDRIYATVRELWEKVPDAVSDADIDAIQELLKPLTKVDEAVKQAHISDIRRKYEKPEPAGLICPRCGAPLVLRTARKGANAGNQFYGCSNFPKCRFIQNVTVSKE